MHASIHELLSRRDSEPVEAEVAQHIDECSLCTHELQQLSLVRSRLAALPQLDAPASAWTRIQQSVSSTSRAATRWKPIAGAVAASAAMLAIILGVALRDAEPPSIVSTGPQESVQATTGVETRKPVAELVAQSQELEQLLQALPERPLIERVSTAATLDTIEQRIQWLDFQLSYAPEGSLDDIQSQRLWRERVELMDSLVKVRYAESRRLTF